MLSRARIIFRPWSLGHFRRRLAKHLGASLSPSASVGGWLAKFERAFWASGSCALVGPPPSAAARLQWASQLLGSAHFEGGNGLVCQPTDSVAGNYSAGLECAPGQIYSPPFLSAKGRAGPLQLKLGLELELKWESGSGGSFVVANFSSFSCKSNQRSHLDHLAGSLLVAQSWRPDFLSGLPN